MTQLEMFYAHFVTQLPETHRKLWTLKNHVVRSILFRNSTVLVEDERGRLSCIAQQTHDTTLYGHLAFMIQYLVDFYLAQVPEFTVDLYGLAYQAFIPLSDINIKTVVAEGEVVINDKVSHFNKVTAVIVSRN